MSVDTSGPAAAPRGTRRSSGKHQKCQRQANWGTSRRAGDNPTAPNTMTVEEEVRVSDAANRTEAENVSLGHLWKYSDSPVVRLPIESLLPADSPRTGGENKSHAELMALASELPPIVVHRSTMRVIDGMHRLRAAKLRNQKTIDVKFFDGTTDEAFVIAVATNVAHGMPLSRNDRKAAAARILRTYPGWSDRFVASTTGLSHCTVAVIRQCATGQNDQLNDRIGKDGKVRPINTINGRMAAAELIRADKSASLREVAKKAGISPGTVRDVRTRLAQGIEPAAIRQTSGQTNHSGRSNTPRRDGDADRRETPSVVTRIPSSSPTSLAPHTALQRLRVNPALRFNEDGRALIRLLTANLANPVDCQRLADGAPGHCLNTIAEIASTIGEAWHQIASDLRRKSQCG